MAWIARPDGEVVWYNRRWHEYTGKSPEEMQRQGWEVLHDPDILPEVQLRLRKSLAEGTSFEMVFPLRAADGSFRPFLTLVAPLRGEDGTILQWFGTNTDITHRRKLEDELRKLAAGLAEADRRKNEFLAVLAHELRNPLAPILTALELMRLGDNDDRETAEMRQHDAAANPADGPPDRRFARRVANQQWQDRAAQGAARLGGGGRQPWKPAVR